MKGKLLCLALLFLSFQSLAQQPAILDSLAQALPGLPESEKLAMHRRLFAVERTLPLPERISFQKKVIDLAAENRDTFFLRNGYARLADLYRTQGDTLGSRQWRQRHREIAVAYGWPVDHGYESRWNFYNMDFTNISNGFLIFRDQGGALDFEDVVASDFSDHWTLNTTLDEGIDTTAVYWAKLKVKGSEGQAVRQLFNVGYGTRSWDQIDLYVSEPGGEWTHQRLGLALPAAERPVRDAFNFFFVDLKPAEVKTLILRLERPNPTNIPRLIALRAIRAEGLSELEGYRPLRLWPDSVQGYASQRISRSLEVVTDTFGTYELEEVQKIWSGESQMNDWRSFRSSQYTYWLKVRLLGSLAHSGDLLFLVGDGPHFWREINIFIPDGGGGFDQLDSGDRRWPHRKTIPDPENLFRVHLSAGDTMDVFLRMKPDVGTDGFPSSFALQEVEPTSFWTKKTTDYFRWGGLYGMISLQALFFIVLFLMVREKLHLYYFIFLAGIFLATFLISNPWFPDLRKMSAVSLIGGISLAVWGFLKYEESLLDVARHLPRLSRYVRLFSWILLAFAPLLLAILFSILYFPFDEVQVNIQWLVSFFALAAILVLFGGLVLMLIINVQALRKKIPLARFFTVANLVLLLSTFSLTVFLLTTLTLEGLGIIPEEDRASVFSSWVESLFALATIGLILALILFATAIGYRTNLLKKEKEKALQRQLASEQAVNQRLRQVDQLKDQFLANTSHELRTPLHGIIGLSESMIDQTETPRHRENLEMIVSSGRRLASMVDDILDFSKLREKEIVLQRKAVDMHTLAGIVLRSLAPLARGKYLQLINDIPADPPPVAGDENRLQQVLYNLVGNAVKFTETGFVRLGSREILPPTSRGGEDGASGKITFFVEDTGIGIPEDKRKAIFQEFEQGDGATTREYAGTGLGLSISKRLVELHGGEMWVESEVGRRSTFFFSLPVSTEKAVAAEATQPVSQVEAGISLSDLSTEAGAAVEATGGTQSAKVEGGQGEEQVKSGDPIIMEILPPTPSRGRENNTLIKILIVDDEPINQQVLKNHLAGERYELTEAMNGEEALRAIDSGQRFDLVLLDVMMPRISGYEVCQRIREKYLASELPVIMVTARNQVQDLVQGLSYGANDYLAKPFSREEFLARVKTQLNLHRINATTGKFVPNEFLRVLGRESITEVALGDQAQREVTILFTDVRDYTSLAEAMTPEENFKFVNALFSRMGPVIRRHGGFVNQYLGDAIMAIFPGSPQDGLQAAVAMQQTLAEYNVKRKVEGRQMIRMGIGLHTGSLAMGIIGDEQRMDAATIADSVNTAARIEGLTKHYGVSILFSEDSLRRLESSEPAGEQVFHLRYLGKVQVKGRREPVGLYECFDGDAPEVIDQKLRTKPDFEKALAYFYARDFPEAVGAFNKVVKVNKNDQPARLFLNKSSQYTINGVPDDWTGVEMMDVK